MADDPVPMPVSNAASMAPNAAPRRANGTWVMTYAVYAGCINANPAPKMSAATPNEIPPLATASNARPAGGTSRHLVSTRRCPHRSSDRPSATRAISIDTAIADRNRLRGETPRWSAYSAEKLVNPP